MVLSEKVHEKPTDYTTFITAREDNIEYNKRDWKTKEKARTSLLKRIPLERLMDLKIDYAFKQLFGSEKNKDITVIFLNAILQRTDGSRITDITFANTDSSGEYVDDKDSRFDLLVRTEDNELINVEIQFTNNNDMVKRSIFYWARVYRNLLNKGMAYNDLRPVIAINILNFDLFDQTERFHTSYHLYEDKDRFKLTDVMEFHFIEMGKLLKDWKKDKLDPWNDILARWLLMLGMVDRRNAKYYDDIYAELEAISMKDELLRMAFENWEELSMNQEQYMAYESRSRRILDEESFQRNMEVMSQEIERNKKEVEHKEKELEHKEKELEQKLEKLAHRLLAKGMEIEFVVESTGLKRDIVIEIHRDMLK